MLEMQLYTEPVISGFAELSVTKLHPLSFTRKHAILKVIFSEDTARWHAASTGCQQDQQHVLSNRFDFCCGQNDVLYGGDLTRSFIVIDTERCSSQPSLEHSPAPPVCFHLPSPHFASVFHCSQQCDLEEVDTSFLL